MEISSSIAETADLYKQNTESESDDFEELISRTFEKIFPAKDGPDPMLDSFFSDARGSPDPDDLDFNPKYSNILPLPAVALTEQEENFEYLGEVDKENVININSNLEMNSKPHGFKSNLNLLRKSIILSSELDVKTTQDQESEAESEPSQHSQSQIGTQFTPQRFKCFQELEIDNTTPAQHLDVNNTISNGPLRSLKNDLFVKVVTSQASIRLSNPSLSISSSGQSEFPPASLPMSQTQSAGIKHV